MFLYAPSLQLHKSFSVQPLSADPSGQWPVAMLFKTYVYGGSIAGSVDVLSLCLLSGGCKAAPVTS